VTSRRTARAGSASAAVGRTAPVQRRRHAPQSVHARRALIYTTIPLSPESRYRPRRPPAAHPVSNAAVHARCHKFTAIA
jgi:hypothetical protein